MVNLYCYNIIAIYTLNVKLFNSQLEKLKSEIKNGTEVTLNFSSNVIGNSNDETYFPHRLLLIDIRLPKVSRLPEAFANSWSANKKLAQLSKMVQLEEFLQSFAKIIGKIAQVKKKL